MANIIELTCPVDGLAFDVSFLEEWSAYMATWSVGMANSFSVDTVIRCPNDHGWGVNFQVGFERTA